MNELFSTAAVEKLEMTNEILLLRTFYKTATPSRGSWQTTVAISSSHMF